MTDTSLKSRALSFQPHIETSDAFYPLLPLTHSTGIVTFVEIAHQGRIACSLCNTFNEEIAYLFYGRPAYRPLRGTLNTSNPSFRPIAILLDPSALPEPDAAYALDSGAFSEGLFSEHCPPDLTIENFRIDGGLASVARFVKFFYGDNRRYYLGRILNNVDVSPIDLVAGSYLSIQRNSGQTALDDRRSTIELQVRTEVKLDSSSVLAVAIPDVMLDSPELRSILVDNWQADIISYDIYHDRPIHDVREMMSNVKRYLERKHLL